MKLDWRMLAILLICGGTSQRLRGQQADVEQMLSSGSAALQRGDNAGAEMSFRQALVLNPKSVMILNNLAISLARQRKEDEAIALYERALAISPGDSVTLRNLGVAYFRAGRYSAALPMLQAFADATPTFQALDLTGLDLFALDRYEEAARFLARASLLAPDDQPTLNMLGKAYLRTKKLCWRE